MSTTPQRTLIVWCNFFLLMCLFFDATPHTPQRVRQRTHPCARTRTYARLKNPHFPLFAFASPIAKLTTDEIRAATTPTATRKAQLTTAQSSILLLALMLALYQKLLFTHKKRSFSPCLEYINHALEYAQRLSFARIAKFYPVMM